MGQTIHNCHNKYIKLSHVLEGFPGGLGSKEFACNTGDPGSIPELGRCPGEGIATHSRILARRIPWTGEPGRLQSMGSQRIKQD